MRAPVEEEASRHRLGEPGLKQQRRRPEDQQSDLWLAHGPGIPEAFDGLAPAPDLLDFVQHQEHGGVLGGRPDLRQAPLGLDPLGPGWQGRVGRGIERRRVEPRHQLPGERRLADLPRPDEGLNHRRMLMGQRHERREECPFEAGIGSHRMSIFTQSLSIMPDRQGMVDDLRERHARRGRVQHDRRAQICE